MSRYVGSSHALTHTIHEEEQISSTRLQHSNLANQSEISIILCQPIRIKKYLVTLLQFIKICSIVLIDAATNQRSVLFSIDQSTVRYQSYYLRPSLRILLPLMIQVPSLSSVALLGKGVSNMFGSHWVIPISMDPLQLWIFLSILTWSTDYHWFRQFIESYSWRWSKETMR